VAVDWVTVWHGSGLNGSVDDGSSGLSDSAAMWQHGSGSVWQSGVAVSVQKIVLIYIDVYQSL
jgi:hypothetical protein